MLAGSGREVELLQCRLRPQVEDLGILGALHTGWQARILEVRAHAGSKEAQGATRRSPCPCPHPAEPLPLPPPAHCALLLLVSRRSRLR